MKRLIPAQPDIQLENYPDIFEGNGGVSIKYPVYTIDPAMHELSMQDKPQWILISWFWNPNRQASQIYQKIG